MPRIKRTDADDTARLRIEPATGRLGHTLRRPEQEHLELPPPGLARSKRLEHVGAGNSRLEGEAHQSREPQHGHAVGGGEIAHVHGLAEGRVGQTLRQEVEVAGGDEERPGGVRCRLDARERGGHVDHVDRHAEHAIDLAREVVGGQRVAGGPSAICTSVMPRPLPHLDDRRAVLQAPRQPLYLR